MASEGALAGLVLRERNGGRGWRVDSSLWSAALALQAHLLDAAGSASRIAGRPVWGVLNRPLKTTDGYLQVDVDDERALHTLARRCGVRVDGIDRGSAGQKIAACIATEPSAVWEPLLTSAGLSCAPVCVDLAELANDAGVAGLFNDVHGCRLPITPWKFAL